MTDAIKQLDEHIEANRETVQSMVDANRFMTNHKPSQEANWPVTNGIDLSKVDAFFETKQVSAGEALYMADGEGNASDIPVTVSDGVYTITNEAGAKEVIEAKQVVKVTEKVAFLYWVVAIKPSVLMADAAFVEAMTKSRISQRINATLARETKEYLDTGKYDLAIPQDLDDWNTVASSAPEFSLGGFNAACAHMAIALSANLEATVSKELFKTAFESASYAKSMLPAMSEDIFPTIVTMVKEFITDRSDPESFANKGKVSRAKGSKAKHGPYTDEELASHIAYVDKLVRERHNVSIAVQGNVDKDSFLAAMGG